MQNGQEEGQKIIIPDEEGNEELFDVLCTFELEETGRNYVMVIPEDGDSEVDEVYAFRYEEEEGGDLNLHLIEDDEEWEVVESTFQTLVEEEQI